MISRGRRLRLYAQLPCLAAAIVLLWPLPVWKEAARFVVQMSPFVAICSTVALKATGLGVLIGWSFGLIAIAKPRWFCRYACPVGLLLEGAAHMGLRKTSWWTRLPQIGQYVALLTLIGAVVGYPLLLWLDPLAIFSSCFAIRAAGNALSGFLAGLLLGLLILLSFTSGSVWCARLCPLGATLDLLASAKSAFRKIRNLRFREAASEAANAMRGPLKRRAFILGAAGIGLGLWAKQLGAMRRETAPLRPPGALTESQFAGVCVRCGNCLRTCPSKILYPDTGEAGLAGFLAPVARFHKNYCLEDCVACTRVCPSGAIRSLDLPEKQKYIIGEALVDGSICLLALGKKDCDACARACPYDAIRIYWDEQQYIAYPVVDLAKCNGCGACELSCPVRGTKAIQVWKKLT